MLNSYNVFHAFCLPRYISNSIQFKYFKTNQCNLRNISQHVQTVSSSVECSTTLAVRNAIG